MKEFVTLVIEVKVDKGLYRVNKRDFLSYMSSTIREWFLWSTHADVKVKLLKKAKRK